MAQYMIRLRGDGSDRALLQAREIWPHAIARRTNLREDNPIRDWCTQHFGLCGSRVHREESDVSGQSSASVTLDDQRTWAETGELFLFRDADQAFEFKMRWHGVDE